MLLKLRITGANPFLLPHLFLQCEIFKDALVSDVCLERLIKLPRSKEDLFDMVNTGLHNENAANREGNSHKHSSEHHSQALRGEVRKTPLMKIHIHLLDIFREEMQKMPSCSVINNMPTDGEHSNAIFVTCQDGQTGEEC